MEKFNYKRELIFWPLLLLPIVYIIYIWGQMTDTIPVHFDLNGTANGWGSKWIIFLLPAINIGVYLLILFLPRIDPKRQNNDSISSIFYKIRLLIVFFMCIVSILASQAAIKGNMDKGVSGWVPVGVFLFLAVLGNFMINIKPNWFIGVRTPWTLSSDAVWRKTHQVMGRLWFYGGLLCAALSFFTTGEWIGRLILTFVLGSAAFAFGYSFWLYKREKQGINI